ncbi:MAG: hypothetical protein JW783_13285 [Bacteroidales bacterium]|nr:hypothetical protein [Bacteroidales bacterium]
MINSGNSRTNLTSILVLVFLLRLGIPYGNFLLLPLLAFSLVIAIVKVFKLGLKSFVKDSLGFSLLLSFAILLISYLFFSNHHKILTIEIVHSLSAFVVLFVLLLLIETKEELAVFFSKLKLLIIVFSAVIGLLGVSKLILQFRGVTFDFLTFDQYPAGSSLTIDSNYFSLFILFGIVLLLSEMLYKHSWRKVSFYQAVLLILTLNVVLSTSRRGFIIALAFFVLISFLSFLSLFVKKEKLLQFRSNTRFYLLSVTVVVGLGLYFLFGLSPIKRAEIVVKSPFSKSLSDYLTSLVFENQSIFKGDSLNYTSVRDNLWRGDFDPLYPYSGWGVGNYSIVQKLEGNNVEIVPKGSVGYKIDKSFSAKTWKGGAYFSNLLFKGKLTKGMRYIPSVYCYVSEDFNGDWVRINGKGSISGLVSSYYDLNRKGEWQKLQATFGGDSSNFEVLLSASKLKAQSFDSLTGYIVFAYPSIDSLEFDPSKPISWTTREFKEVYPLTGKNVEIVPQNAIGCLLDSTSNLSVSDENGKFISSNVLNFETERGYRYLSSIYVYVSPDFNGEKLWFRTTGLSYSIIDDHYDLTKKGTWQKLHVNAIGGNGKSSSEVFFNWGKYNGDSFPKGYVILAYPDYIRVKFDPKNPDTYSPHRFYKKLYPLKGAPPQLKEGTVGYSLNKLAPGRTWKDIYYSSNIISKFSVNKNDSVRLRSYCFVSEVFNGNQVRVQINGDCIGVLRSSYNMKRKGTWQLLEAKAITKGGWISVALFFSQKNVTNFNSLTGNVIFAYPEISVKRKGKWIAAEDMSDIEETKHTSLSKITSLDSAYHEVKLVSQDSVTDFVMEPVVNHFSGPRVVRWRYAWYLYTKEYSWWQKIIGKGHFHTEKFAKMFKKDENGYEYPHNPLLSVLLYSGILGLLAYLWLLFKVFSFYWLYKKDYWVWGLCFLATFFFSFFSANSPFDPAVMALFMVLPFLIHAKSILPSSGFNKSLINK